MRLLHVRFTQSFAMFALLAACALAVAAQSYTITDLGTFSGGTVSQGNAVNLAGQVAGFARFSNFNAHGILWTASHGLKDLGAIPPQTNFSVAQGINTFADIVGYSDYDQLQHTHATLWSKGKIYDLGTLAGGDISTAYAINDNGVIAGFSNGTGISPHGVIWKKGGAMTDLGTLAGGYYSQAVAVNLEGVVVGFSNAQDGNWHAFVWTATHGMQALPNPQSAYSAGANGINNLGQIVGGSGNYAVLWKNDASHTPETLGTLSGQSWSSAFAINNASQVVGWSGFIAFVWTKEAGMLDLNKLIPANSGWQLTAANGINDRGQITGEGNINGQTHGFLLTPVD